MTTLVSRQVLIYIFLLALTSVVTTYVYFQTRSEWILYHKGKLLYDDKNYGKAAILLQQALDDGAGSRDAYFYLGDSYAADKQFEEAEKVFRSYLVNNPKDLEARVKLARVLSYMGKLDESQKEYEQVIKEENALQKK